MLLLQIKKQTPLIKEDCNKYLTYSLKYIDYFGTKVQIELWLRIYVYE